MHTELIAISELKVEAPFASLFPIGKETLESIRTDMESKGFDETFPVIVWEEKNIVVDGHTRFAAARELAMEKIPVIFKTFENEDDAILYCFHIQRNRRNLADEDILRCLEVLDNITPPVGKKKASKEISATPSKKEQDILRAKELGTSVAKAEKARKLLEHGSEEIKQSVTSGEKSINQAYQEVQEQRRESGELRGKVTTGLGNSAKYTKALGSFLRELARLKDNDWQDVTRQKVFEDLASITKFVES